MSLQIKKIREAIALFQENYQMDLEELDGNKQLKCTLITITE